MPEIQIMLFNPIRKPSGTIAVFIFVFGNIEYFVVVLLCFVTMVLLVACRHTKFYNQ